MRLGIKTQVDAPGHHDHERRLRQDVRVLGEARLRVKVLEGTVVDEEYFAYICQLDPCEACRAKGATQPTTRVRLRPLDDERVWPKVNPAILELPQLVHYLRGVVKQAQNQPSTLAR
jgi:phage terminase large subunit-like protein